MDLNWFIIGISIFAIVGTVALPIGLVYLSVKRLGTPPDAQTDESAP